MEACKVEMTDKTGHVIGAILAHSIYSSYQKLHILLSMYCQIFLWHLQGNKVP